MAKYRKKPVIIDAWKWEGKEQKNADEFCKKNGLPIFKISVEGSFSLIIPTLEGYVSASPGDYIIRGIEGEYYPCKPDIFEKTYEPIEED